MNEQQKPEPVIIEDEETALAVFDDLDNVQLDAEVGDDALAMLDPDKAAQLVAGVRPDTLVYVVERWGQDDLVGLSAQGTQILAMKVGGFETRAEGEGSVLTETTMQLDVKRIVDGQVETVAEALPGIRASVQVCRTNPSGQSAAFVGIDEECCFIALRTYMDKKAGKLAGGGVKVDPKAAVKAWNKAERNATRKFFASTEKLLADFAAIAKKRGQALMIGDEEEVKPYQKAAGDVMAHRDARRRETLAQEPKWTDAQVASFRALQARHSIPQEAIDRQLGLFGVLKVEDLPASALVAMKKWADDYTTVNGQPEPTEPPKAPEAAPAEDDAEPDDYAETVAAADAAAEIEWREEKDDELDARLQEVGRALGYPPDGVLQLVKDKTDGNQKEKEFLLGELEDHLAQAEAVAAENTEPGREQQLPMG